MSLWPTIKLDGAFCSTSYVSTITKCAYKNRSEVKTSVQRSASDRLGNSEGDTRNQKEEGEDVVGVLSHLENHHLAAGAGGDRSQLFCHFFSLPFYQLLWIPSLPLRFCLSSPPFNRFNFCSEVLWESNYFLFLTLCSDEQSRITARSFGFNSRLGPFRL